MNNMIENKQQLDILIQNKKGFIFDMDGTILDSMAMWDTFCSKFLIMHGKEPDRDVDKVVKTMTVPLGAKYLKDKYELPLSEEEIMGQVFEMTGNLYKNELLLKEKAMSLITYLYNNNIDMIVATATEYNMAKMALKRNGILKYFKGILTCSMVGASKHEPDIYLKACEALKLSINDCIICEDSFFAAQTAKKSGFDVLGVYDYAEKDNWDKIVEITDYQVVLD